MKLSLLFPIIPISIKTYSSFPWPPASTPFPTRSPKPTGGGNDLLEQFPHPPTHLSVVISQNNPDHHFLLLDGINACMITGGPIREIDPVTHTLRADLITLTATDYNFQIRPATYDPDLFPQLKEGDLITSHHGIVAEIIDRPALENLEKWTGIVIRNFISATPADQSHP